MATKRKPARNPGRPTTFTEARYAAILARMAKGEPLAKICRDEDMPCPNTVRTWAGRNESDTARFARAREDGFDAIAVQCLEIADDSRNDFIEGLAEEGDAGAKLAKAAGEVIQRSKLRVETRLKLLAVWDAARYGNKIQHADANGNVLETPVFNVVPFSQLPEAKP